MLFEVIFKEFLNRRRLICGIDGRLSSHSCTVGQKESQGGWEVKHLGMTKCLFLRTNSHVMSLVKVRVREYIDVLFLLFASLESDVLIARTQVRKREERMPCRCDR